MKKTFIARSILVAAMLVVVIGLTANAQKLPQIQDVSVRAPDNVKIDGKLNEWPNPLLNAQKTDGYLNAYNSTIRIYYTIANDDNNLYIVMRGLGTRVVVKSLSDGFTITISHSTDKKGRAKAVDNIAVSFPQPVDDKTINTVLAPIRGGFDFYNEPEIYPAGYPYIKQLDSIQTITNAVLTPFIKEIKVSGIKEIQDTLLSVYNETGIKAMMQFIWRQPVYELAIPLKYLKLDINSPVKFSYNIKLGMARDPNHGMRGVYDDPPTAQENYLYSNQDFWGEYTLAKKP